MAGRPQWYLSEVANASDGDGQWGFQAQNSRGEFIAEAWGRTKAQALGRMRTWAALEGARIRWTTPPHLPNYRVLGEARLGDGFLGEALT